jgi:hypothetical protein
MVNIKIYVEGGGDSSTGRIKCRQGFSKFFEKAGLKGSMPRISACGSRKSAYDDFCTALRAKKTDDYIILLVDSEGSIPEGCQLWNFFHDRAGDNWDKPADAKNDNVHCMVQCMENWFLADKATLERYFGQGFNRHALPGRTDIENISKAQVYQCLKDATRLSVTKGEYDKGDHSFELLGLIDPELVINASPSAKRLIALLKQLFH